MTLGPAVLGATNDGPGGRSEFAVSLRAPISDPEPYTPHAGLMRETVIALDGSSPGTSRPYTLSEFGLTTCDAIADGPYCLPCAEKAAERFYDELRDAAGNPAVVRLCRETGRPDWWEANIYDASGALLDVRRSDQQPADITPHHPFPIHCFRCGSDFSTSGGREQALPGAPGSRWCWECWADTVPSPDGGRSTNPERYGERERAYRMRLGLSRLRDRQEALASVAVTVSQTQPAEPVQVRELPETLPYPLRRWRDGILALHKPGESLVLSDLAESVGKTARTFRNDVKRLPGWDYADFRLAILRREGLD